MLDITVLTESGESYWASQEDLNRILDFYRAGKGPTNSTTLSIEGQELFVNLPEGGIAKAVLVDGISVDLLFKK